MDKSILSDLFVTLQARLHMKPFPLVNIILQLNFEHWRKH